MYEELTCWWYETNKNRTSRRTHLSAYSPSVQLLHTISISTRASQPWGSWGINWTGRAIPQPFRKMIYTVTPSTDWNMIVKWAVKRLCKSLGSGLHAACETMLVLSCLGHSFHIREYLTKCTYKSVSKVQVLKKKNSSELPWCVCEWMASRLLAVDWSKWKCIFRLVDFHQLIFFAEG